MSTQRPYDAIVVGSGPNGLAAGITLARARKSVLLIEAKNTVGGGTRTRGLTLPGFLHDVCAAVHPLALASPFFRSLDLEKHGLSWIHPPVQVAHPLDDQSAVLLHRSIDKTADELGSDAEAYRKLIGPSVEDWDKLMHDLLKPLGFPKYPRALLGFGPRAILSAVTLTRRWFAGIRARALFAGNSAHSIMPLDAASTAAFGLMLSILGHAVGWPLARGGSQTIADALASYLKSLGGTISVGTPVESYRDLPSSRVVLFDVTPRQLLRIAGSMFPEAYRHRLEQHRYGPGVFKVDWALDAPIPWRDPACLLAGTLHLGGTFEEIAESELLVSKGSVPHKPMVLLSQPTLFDPTRAPEGKHTAWAYCHVPNGCLTDMTARIENQIERFAPGFRDRIIARSVMSPRDMEEYNPNYVGGDIAGGMQRFRELFLAPLGRLRAYSTPVKGIYLCSSSMPPGAGVHGMCGFLAAERALAESF